MKRILIILYLLGCALLQSCSDLTEQVKSLGTLERDRIELTAETNEAITRIYVEEGDLVELGALLVQQDMTRANIALDKANADESVASAALKQAEAGPRQQQISAARARLEAAISNRRTANFELTRILSLVARKLASQNQVDLLQGAFDASRAKVDEATASLDELLEGTRSEEIDRARSQLLAAVAVVKNLNVTLARASIISPLEGVVEALPYEIGERPQAGATIVVLLAANRSYAKVYISETLRTQLSIGDEAIIKIDGRAQPLAGRIRWISNTAAFTPYYALNQYDRSRLSYLAEIDVVKDELNLPTGVPVEVSFPSIAE